MVEIPTDILQRKIAIRKQLLEMDAPRLFRQFIPFVNPAYERQWYHTLIADRCQDLLEGRIRNLMVFVPPQHGKSEIVSRCFPAYAFGRFPNLKIIGCSYSATLAKQFSRGIQRIMDSQEYSRIFPNTRLNGSNVRKLTRGYIRNVDLFEIVNHKGFYKTQGVCGGLTGTAVDIAIIDDPVKDAIEAYSPTYRERVWDWYTSVLLTRLHNNSRQLFIMTRWHEDDLAGRILQREPENWTVISIPAIRETLDDGNADDPRQVGEALWPNKHSLESLLAAQTRSPRVFSALYQQHPTADGGNIVKREWFKHISRAEFDRMHNQEPIIFFIDTAYTDKTSNDPSGILATCKIGDDLYITHAQKVYKNFPDFIRFIPPYVKAQGYTSRSSIRIEPKANGLSVIDQIKDITALNVTRTPSPSDSKETRLNASAPCVECGRVVLVDGAWNEEFVEEVCGFPVKPHDEFVDCLCYAISHHLTSPFKPIDRDRLARIVH
jgi:predicted phage terminase large subunit-like protein